MRANDLESEAHRWRPNCQKERSDPASFLWSLPGYWLHCLDAGILPSKPILCHFAYLRARLGTSFSEKKWVTRRLFVGGLLLWYDAQNFLILDGYLCVKVSFEKIEKGLAPGGYILR